MSEGTEERKKIPRAYKFARPQSGVSDPGQQVFKSTYQHINLSTKLITLIRKLIIVSLLALAKSFWEGGGSHADLLALYSFVPRTCARPPGPPKIDQKSNHFFD